MRVLVRLLRLGLVGGLAGLAVAARAQSAAVNFDLVRPAGTQVSGTAWGPVVTSMVADNWGNLYVTGNYTGTVQLGSTQLAVSSSLPGWTKRTFVAKMDATGAYQWALDVDGSAQLYQNRLLATDAAGNVYLTGVFEGPGTTFGPYQLNCPAGRYGLYVLKLAPDGSYLWARQATSGGTEPGKFGVGALTVDGSGNVYLTGGYKDGSVTFGPVTIPNATPGHVSAFVAKLSAAGTWDWVTGTTGTYASEGDSGQALATDARGNVYVAGSFGSGTLGMGPVSITNNNPYGFTTDGFVAKLSAGGQWQWARRLGGSGYDSVEDLAVDGAGNVMAHGTLHGAPDANSCVQVPVSNGNFELYVARFSPAGVVRWATSAGGQQYDLASQLALDAAGNAYVTGRFDSSPAQFGPATVSNAGAQYKYEAYVAKIDTAGSWQWAQQSVGLDANEGQGVAVDPSGVVWTFGNCRSATTTFAPLTLAQPGAFVARLGSASYPLVVGGVVPASGSPGQLVTVTGSRFVGVTGVYFNGMPASSFTVLSQGRLQAVVPPGASSGRVEVRTAIGGNGAAPLFQVTGVLAASAARAAPPVQVWPQPLPAGQRLHLQLPVALPAGQHGQAVLRSVLGAEVQRVDLAATDNSLLLPAVAAGVYILSVELPGQPPFVRQLVLE